MSKQKLKCICPICGEAHELEADIIMPGVQGVIYDPEGRPLTILDSTKTERHCGMCAEALVRNLVCLYTHVEVEDE